MTRGALVGLAGIVAMVTEPWWGPLLHHRPRPKADQPTEDQGRPPVRGVLLRPGRELDRGDR